MPQIKVLPVELSNKIAAGEVVERPASVVKELLENAIDAKSTDIKIEVLRGGRGLVRVTDNGTGMDREDALLCILRHATSKLKSEDDLFNITTMGFRGEALPSIASVSKMKIVTGLKEAMSGVSIEIAGGEIIDERAAPSMGTLVEVRDLFFNTPARKKFLKTDATELYHIIDSVTKAALSHPDTGFTLFTEDRETMTLPAASGQRERILQIYGMEFTQGLIEVSSEDHAISMLAFVSKSENFRNTKSHQFIFINNRPVKDPAISNAVYKAYEGILPQDRHPVFFVYLDLDPKAVDFNVHPAKREVRFADKEKIHRFVMGSLRNAIKSERERFTAPFYGEEGSPQPAYKHLPSSFSIQPQAEIVSENLEMSYSPQAPFIYLGETFIATAGKGGLTLIDHHAAHERILYEQFLIGINLKPHQLLFPQQMKLSHKEFIAVIGNRALLNEMGIEVDEFGHDTLIVRSLPDALHGADLRGILSDAAAAIIEGDKPNRPLKELLAAKIACHSSVRGKAVLNQEELRQLLSDLEKTEHPDQCPHGRPTRLFFSLDDLKKMFKRK